MPPGALQQMFSGLGLPPGATVIERFACKLFQTYTCAHNACTPDVQMSFGGQLYITERHACFDLEERGKKLPVVVELTSAGFVIELRVHTGLGVHRTWCRVHLGFRV
jgi:hypothetical protein